METVELKEDKKVGQIEILAGFEEIQDKLKYAYDDEFDENKISGIYAIVIKYNGDNNNRRYISSSIDMKKEFIDTKDQLYQQQYNSSQIQRLFNTGGHLWFELLEECDSKEFDTRTNYYINYYNTTHVFRGFNKQNIFCKTKSIDTVNEISNVALNEEKQIIYNRDLDIIRMNKNLGIKSKLFNEQTKQIIEGTYQELTTIYGLSDKEVYLLTENKITNLGIWHNADTYNEVQNDIKEQQIPFTSHRNTNSMTYTTNSDIISTNTSGVYIIYNTLNGITKRFIGSTNNLEKNHVKINKQLSEGTFKNKKIQQLFDKGLLLEYIPAIVCDKKEFKEFEDKLKYRFNTTNAICGFN